MKIITYGIFAEDAANRIFMKNTIPQLVEYFDKSSDIAFQHEDKFTEFVRPNNGLDTRERFIGAADVGFDNFGLDVCFVGADCDDDEFENVFSEMQKSCINEDVQDRILIYIPVQAMEYWLWYIKVKAEDAALQKTPPIETENRKDMKKKVYNRIKPTNTKSNPIVESLSNSFDINWLRQCSDSFDAFAKEFENYIKKL